ncbi:cysteine-rich receptor-like protein kinase 7 [Arachis hypogaea]|uniref:cysteine-rich receptor-like protein kinase 7 n=1 Tax=Arachis hypogaea TaxID=3818 RepID=UPI000DEC6908|nr:cysteine-rich receptor-like protein kinase 7 [Arachis hypogaea]
MAGKSQGSDVEYIRKQQRCLILLLKPEIAKLCELLLPIPIFHISNCTGNSTFELNSTNHTNLKTLLSWFSSNATNSAGSHIAKVVSSGNSSVYGLFQCNADIMPEKCQKCIDQAVYNVTSECTTSKEAVVFVKFYFLRYSYKDFLTIA